MTTPTTETAKEVLRGYGREMELEADRLGAEYLVKTGYNPQAIIDVVGVLKNQEVFEMDLARAEGREPRIYHGVFSTHPSADARLQQAVQVAGKPSGNSNGRIGKEDYFKHIEGLSFGGSKAQGIVRDNRFYHAGLGITVAFPKDWVVLNQRNRLLTHTRSQDSILQMTAEGRPENISPREYLVKELGRVKLTAGEDVTIDGNPGYAVVAATGSPLDQGRGPVRYVAVFRDKMVYIFAAASRSSQEGIPEADRIFMSTAQTLRGLKPSEFPLTEPNRVHIEQADASTRMGVLARSSPIPKYPEQILRLINDLYPNKEPVPGQMVKVVQ